MENKVKIFFVFQDLSITGAPIVFSKYLKIAKEQKKLEISVFARYCNQSHLELNNIKVLHFRLPINLVQIFLFKLYDFCFFVLSVIINKPDVIIVNSYTNTIPIIVSKIFNVKSIILVHENAGAIIRFNTIRSFVVRLCRNVIAVSTATYNFCLLQKIPKSRISLIRNGLDLTHFSVRKFKSRSDIITLGAIANWSNFKRLDTIISFYKKLLKFNIKVKLVIGGGAYFDYKHKFDNLILENPDIEFLGVVYDTKSFYSRLDGYLYFSENESYPTVLMESLFFQIPVFTINNLESSSEVLGDAIISSDSIEQLTADCFNFYTKDYLSNISNWHKNCILRLKEIDINSSWNDIYRLILD